MTRRDSSGRRRSAQFCKGELRCQPLLRHLVVIASSAMPLLLPLSEGSAQVVIGAVLRRGGGHVDGAAVRLTDSTGSKVLELRTNRDGEFQALLHQNETYGIDVRRLGFRPYVAQITTRSSTDTIRFSATLESLPQLLPAVRIDAEVERLKDLRVAGYNARSFPATFIPRSQIEAYGRDARTYMDILRKMRITSIYIDEKCVHFLLGGACLNVFLNDASLAGGGDDDMLNAIQHAIAPEDIDHIVYVRPNEAVPDELRGSLLVYTTAYTERMRRRWSGRRK